VGTLLAIFFPARSKKQKKTGGDTLSGKTQRSVEKRKLLREKRKLWRRKRSKSVQGEEVEEEEEEETGMPNHYFCTNNALETFLPLFLHK
jgi:hypothetical protein